jgi:hypothetical protein
MEVLAGKGGRVDRGLFEREGHLEVPLDGEGYSDT